MDAVPLPLELREQRPLRSGALVAPHVDVPASIEQMREPLPFEIAGFLADNCNEYINHRGAKLLQQVQGRVHPPPACALAGAMLAVPPTTDQCSV